MSRKINVLIYAAFILCIALTLATIFGNSTKSVAESKADSNTVVEIVKPIIDPHDKLSESEVSFLVRKSGHFVEYMILGIECGLFAYYICKKLTLLGVISSAFFCLLTANLDEFWQSFTGRGSLVSDVLLDLSGAVVGIAIGSFVAYAFKLLILSRKQKKKSE